MVIVPKNEGDVGSSDAQAFQALDGILSGITRIEESG
jgi:hypothetical protein